MRPADEARRQHVQAAGVLRHLEGRARRIIERSQKDCVQDEEGPDFIFDHRRSHFGAGGAELVHGRGVEGGDERPVGQVMGAQRFA